MKRGFYKINGKLIFGPDQNETVLYVFSIKKSAGMYNYSNISLLYYNNKRKKWELGVTIRDDELMKKYKPKEFTNHYYIIKTIFESTSHSKTFLREIKKL